MVEPVAADDGLVRCPWGTAPPEYRAYHDEEWGRPVWDDDRVYEKLCLEGFQSGLSWLTILRKRDAFRRAFAGFDPEAVATFGEADVVRLLGDSGIVRHRAKIMATIDNARATVRLRQDGISLSAVVWKHEAAASAKLRRLPATCRRRPPSPKPFRPSCAGTGSVSSGRRPPTRRCSPSAW